MLASDTVALACWKETAVLSLSSLAHSFARSISCKP